MADHQRIHPETVEPPTPDLESQQKPTAPLVPRGSSRSENGHPTEPHPPFQRTIPIQYSKPPKKKNWCRRCLCCTLCVVFTLVILIGVLAAVVYFGFDPKLPKYSVDGMTITQFNLNTDNSLSAQFNVNITARNPNTKIGISYEGGSKLTVIYMGTVLCEGAWPKFYQGHRNTTVLNVPLTGQTRDATGLLTSLNAQQQTGTVPLVLRAKVPVRIKLGKLKLPKFKPLVRCRVNVNTLSTDNVIRIRDSSCSFKFRL
ncbi:putative Late embryogenesis abundant protein [Helianthus annuus]|uniref:Late embryogenesis abundant protein, LEA_2 subgroup n=1 Tax=Helianthus annuus TaxID=4232 RepID=A0A251S420_HELAN|nr:NDR1/HIN1-like protein 6 [Helianthus annuus]KAF5762542.1 putative Late embryogenesis abundant protein, LEA_2 subgroup [Helianthus annuus]KAJ0440252.1 putative Late embryogenesis abundant protein [Helianthus annuus]KAJ0445598.1 putative Late embryogenesis abundant protein [Helianthus annuus]KAJ0462634.1 putative Late embryogenesis abundant protein [Helianthus annuus]KAJ0643029.1 putative Late embryogenesis abundant protein [Helianthus annuus]